MPRRLKAKSSTEKHLNAEKKVAADLYLPFDRLDAFSEPRLDALNRRFAATAEATSLRIDLYEAGEAFSNALPLETGNLESGALESTYLQANLRYLEEFVGFLRKQEGVDPSLLKRVEEYVEHNLGLVRLG
jgi:hypothetical protein